jgi:hypothetical protein
MLVARFDVYRIKKPDAISFLPRNADAFSPDADNHMFVLVPFEAAESSRSDFEIPHVKSCRFSVIADQGPFDDVRPVIRSGFIYFRSDTCPGEVSSVLV